VGGSNATGGRSAVGGSGAQSTGGTATGGAATGVNLITNGDFSGGTAYWNLTIQTTGSVTGSASSGAMCLTFAALQTFTLGWPMDPASAASLPSGASYTFSFTVQSTTSVSVTAKVGLAVSPYTADFSQALTVGTTAQSPSYGFTTTASDPQAGIAFDVTAGSTAGQICFDNISLVRVK
jgi:endoglucanase